MITTPPKNGGDSSVSVFVTLIKLLPALNIALNNMENPIQNIGDDTIRELGQILAGILKEFLLLIPLVSALKVSGYIISNVLHRRASISFWKAKITPNPRLGNITISVRLHSIH